MKIILTLLKTKKTVFGFSDLENIFSNTSYDVLITTLLRYRKSGELLNPQKGIWTLPIFNEKELACKIYSWGYISLETVLYEEWIIFQWYGDSTRVVRNNTREKIFEDHKYISRKIKDSIFKNNMYVREKNNYLIATPERALCDLCYLQKKLQIDNIDYFNNDQSKFRFKDLFPIYPKYVEENVRSAFKREI